MILQKQPVRTALKKKAEQAQQVEQERERKEYAVRLRSLWRGEVRPDDKERYRFPLPPARFIGAVPESIPKGLFSRLIRVVADGEMGALLPIHLKADCQMCHGPVEMVDDDIQAAIAEHYPDDHAFGFAEGISPLS